MHYEASAPGKAVLAGEYAVLHGAPAISMALDCRAVAGVQAAGGEWYGVRAPGGNAVRFRMVSDGGLEWERAADGGAWSLLEEVARQGGCALPAGSVLKLDTDAFVDRESGVKLGLGSSSALAVALAAAWLGGRAEPAQVEALAAAAHRALMGGRGSGIDVATALRGGVIGYLREGPVSELQWPERLQYAVLWCGKAASTAEKLVQEEKFSKRGARKSAERLAAEAEAVFEGWQQGGDRAVLERFASYVEALRAYSNDARLGIFDAGHDELASMASEYGMIYKPCGAGGGDIGIALYTQEAQPEDFIARAEGLGFRRLACRLEPRGLAVDFRENG